MVLMRRDYVSEKHSFVSKPVDTLLAITGAKALKYSLMALFASALTGILTGFLLGRFSHLLLLLPGLIILVPGALAIRGTIFGSLGSRLGSALHLGIIENFSFRNTLIKNNILAVLTITTISSVFLGILAKSFSFFSGFHDINTLEIIFVSFLGGIIAGLVLLLITFAVSFTAYKRGWDPDDITSPTITALGDFFTFPSLIAAAYFLFAFRAQIVFLFTIVIIATAVNILYLLSAAIPKKVIYFKEGSYKVIVMQNMPIILVSGAISTMAGFMLQSRIETIIALPSVLILLPAFLAQGGNMGNIIASRLSTKLHLGQIEARFAATPSSKEELTRSYMLSIFIFPVVGILAYIFETSIGVQTIGLLRMVLISLVAGLLLTTVVIFIAFAISFVSFNRNLDPDNIAIPMMQGIADFIGVGSLFVVLMLLGII